MKQKLIYYFGYGANADREMMHAVIGRMPEGKPAKLRNFELCVQHWHEIDDKIKKALVACKWDSTFRTYCARLNVGKATEGVLWMITRDEHRHVGNWKMHGLWYMPTKVLVEAEGKIVEALTEIINRKALKTAIEIHGEICPVFLNDKRKMIQTAEKVRKNFHAGVF